LGGDAAFQKRAGVDAGCCVALKIDRVTLKLGSARAEEMVEADLVERGGAGVGGDVAADVVLDAIGAHDHSEGVPANEALDAAFEFLVAGEKWFEAIGNRVRVWSVGGEWQIDAGNGGVGAKALEDFGGDFGPLDSRRESRDSSHSCTSRSSSPCGTECACHYRWQCWSLQRPRCSRQLSRCS